MLWRCLHILQENTRAMCISGLTVESQKCIISTINQQYPLLFAATKHENNVNIAQ